MKEIKFKMKNIIITIIFGMFLLSCVSAENFTAGESYNFTLSESYEYYSIIGNSTPIDLNIIQEGNIVTITLGKYIKSDIFEIIFFNTEKEIIHHGSSGGSSTRTVYVENKTIEYVDLPIYIEKEIYVEKNETIIDEEIESEDNFPLKSVFISILILGVLIYLFLREPKKGEDAEDETSVTPKE